MQYTALFRRLREQKGLTHDALARLARCHRNTVLNVEAGRQVRLKTVAHLMAKMGYASDSPEMAGLALLWLEAVSGIDLADPSTLGAARQKAATYTRSVNQAAAGLAETVRRAGLSEQQIRLLGFAARNPDVLAVLDSIQSLLATAAAADPERVLKVAEDK